MASLILASDYDGTLAEHGRVSATTVAALNRFRDAGHILVMVTGRELDDVKNIFPEHELFKLIVAENGALMYSPKDKSEMLLASAPPVALVEQLRAREVGPLYVGRVIVATLRSHERAIRETIHGLGLSLNLILNGESVMILPAGVNKASGLEAALRTLGSSKERTVAVGDAENDLHLLAAARYRVAVANAIPELKDMATCVTKKKAGAGVAEVIDSILDGTFDMQTRAVQAYSR